MRWIGWSILTQLGTRPALPWRDVEYTEEDRAHVEKEALDTSPFDPLNLRNTMWKHSQGQPQHVTIRVRECALARVIVLFHREQGDPTPWEFWSRIFSAMGRARSGRMWRVVWFAANSQREYGPPGSAIGPLHINGGYAYPCEPETIIIYRKEEGTRVLIHELLHAGCTDNQSHSTEQKESETETWAELFLIGLLSNGSVQRAQRLWTLQAQWIADQNTILRESHGVNGPAAYAWRYTVGREILLRRLGLALPAPQRAAVRRRIRSLRFTAPALEP